MQSKTRGPSGAEKRPYRKPELTAYGNIRDVTKTISGGSGNLDGMIPINKTSGMT